MKNATVTIDYGSFQIIIEKADLYDKAKRNQEKAGEKVEKFLSYIWNCIDNANDCKTAEQKQYYIAQGIKAICEHYEMDINTEYGELDEGQAPEVG